MNDYMGMPVRAGDYEGTSRASYSNSSGSHSNHFQPGAMVSRQGKESNLQQWTSRFNVMDKRNGSYVKTSMKESSSSGDVFKERSTGKIGLKEEQKKTSTFRCGDKNGYYEHEIAERFRRVSFGDIGKDKTTAAVKDPIVIPTDESSSEDESYDEGSYEDCSSSDYEEYYEEYYDSY